MIMWEPSETRKKQSAMYNFWQRYYSSCQNYHDFHRQTVSHPEVFWKNLLDFYPIICEGDTTHVLKDHDLSFKNYNWFPGLKLNFAENLLAQGQDNDTALQLIHESEMSKKITYKELRTKVKSLASFLKGCIGVGDVLACYMPNTPETVISMLATTALGGVFTSTSCDFGVDGVVERFSQVKPKVLVTALGYEYNGKYFDGAQKIKEIIKSLPTLEKIILVDFLHRNPCGESFDKALWFDDCIQAPDSSQAAENFEFVKIPFNSPLYIMYSSGTTGKPKCIVHSVGGTLLNHIKELGLHTDLNCEKSICFFTTCGWMMWNWLVSSLYFGSRVALYEGAPSFPSFDQFLKKIDHEKINIFGTSAKFLKALETLEDSDYQKKYKFKYLETMLSTGSTLLPEQFDFVYQKIKKDVMLSSISGGTDILGCFMLGNPTLPVRRGEIQCLGLGLNVKAFTEEGTECQKGIQGELVCVDSFPSRPIYFLNDPDGKKINDAYFNHFEVTPKIWYHGDFITITEHGGVIVHGRSDATLNPGGVRIGTAEIYRQTETIGYIEDALCVEQNTKDGDCNIVLFVKMKKGEKLDYKRMDEIKNTIRQNTTPRHVPKDIFEVSDIPYTQSGKKMELLVNKLLKGISPNNLEAVANPECLKDYQQFI